MNTVKKLLTALLLTFGLSNLAMADVLDYHEGNSVRSEVA
ncbi:Uncharacterised protein [Providencia rustigianii]|nr:Uncharacterised protein [Providencia rustigianii]